MLSDTTAAKKSTGTPGAPRLEAAEASVRGSDYVNVPNDSCQHASAAGGRGDVSGKSAAVPGAEAASDMYRQPSEASSNASDPASDPASDSATDGSRSPETETGRGKDGQWDKEAFGLLVQRANSGDEQALQELRHVLDTCPQIWKHVGGIGGHAELSLIRLIAGGNRLLLESLQRNIAEMRAELSRPSASALEKLAVQRVTACWLQLQHADAASSAPDQTLQQGRFWALEQDRAHRRYLSAVKQLTTLRQLLPSNVEADTESALAVDGVPQATRQPKSDVTRSGDGQREPQPDDQENAEFRKQIIPIVDAAGEASG